MDKPHRLKKPRVFYGYWIVAVTFLCVLIFSGCGFYVFSLFVKPLQTDFGWGRGEIMAASTIFFLVMGGTSPFVGRLINRYGVRRVITIGASIAGLGFVLLSRMDSLWHFYASYAIIGMGMAAVGTVPATTVVSNWFRKRRGTALGIMSSGIGAGGVALPPFVGGYLIPNFGWERSYLALALIVWILIPIVLSVIRTKPAEMGLYPDDMQASEVMAEVKASPPASEGLSLRLALTTSAFWLIATSFLIGCLSHVGVIQNQVPHLEDIGFPLAIAATTLSGVGIGSLIGKFGFGWLCDRIPAKYAWCIAMSLQLAAIIIFMSVRPASPATILWLYAIIMGLGVGGWLPTMSILTSTNFGLASYGAIFGMMVLAQSTGTAIGPFIGGYMYDAMNTYHWAFVLFLALYAVAIPTALAIRRPKSLSNLEEGQGR